MGKRSSVLEKEKEYWLNRDIAHQSVAEKLTLELGRNVRLSDINDEALRLVRQWRSLYRGDRSKRAPGWNWDREVEKYRRHYQRVELAIWSGSSLCGLLIGRVSDRRVVASIHLIESNPGSNPLETYIAGIGTRWLIAFAVICGCEEVAIDRPVPALINYYRTLGFKTEMKRKKKIWRLKMSLAEAKTQYNTPTGGAS